MILATLAAALLPALAQEEPPPLADPSHQDDDRPLAVSEVPS